TAAQLGDQLRQAGFADEIAVANRAGQARQLLAHGGLAGRAEKNPFKVGSLAADGAQDLGKAFQRPAFRRAVLGAGADAEAQRSGRQRRRWWSLLEAGDVGAATAGDMQVAA